MTSTFTDVCTSQLPCTVHLKMPGPISQNGNFYSNDASSPKISWFQISFKSVKPFGHKKRLRILQLPIPYCVSLIMVTITSHIFINIFQTVHFSAVKFTRGNEKNMSFLLIPKSQKVWKKSEASGPGSFKGGMPSSKSFVKFGIYGKLRSPRIQLLQKYHV